MFFLLFMLALQQNSRSPGECPNLTGRYVIQGEDGQVYVNIVQTDCTKIAIDWNYSPSPTVPEPTHVLLLDGEFRADSGWFGFRERQLTSARIFPDRLEITYKPRQSADASLLHKLVLELLPDGDLCTRTIDSRGPSRFTLRASRVKMDGLADQEVALERSYKGCS